MLSSQIPRGSGVDRRFVPGSGVRGPVVLTKVCLQAGLRRRQVLRAVHGLFVGYNNVQGALKSPEHLGSGLVEELAATWLSGQGRVEASQGPYSPFFLSQTHRSARSPPYQGWFGAHLYLIPDQGTLGYARDPADHCL